MAFSCFDHALYPGVLPVQVKGSVVEIPFSVLPCYLGLSLAMHGLDFPMIKHNQVCKAHCRKKNNKTCGILLHCYPFKFD